MIPNTADFRNILVQFCRDWQVRSKDIFNTFDVEETLEHAGGEKMGDRELAAQILWKCCCANGKFNNASVVFLAVIKFLKERLGDIGQQPFMDLGRLLKEGTTEEAIRRWIETHYP